SSAEGPFSSRFFVRRSRRAGASSLGARSSPAARARGAVWRKRGKGMAMRTCLVTAMAAAGAPLVLLLAASVADAQPAKPSPAPPPAPPPEPEVAPAPTSGDLAVPVGVTAEQVGTR